MDCEASKKPMEAPETMAFASTDSKTTGLVSSRPATADSPSMKSRCKSKSKTASNAQKLKDQHLDKRSLQMASSVIRMAPLGPATFFNNKVGSSMINSTQLPTIDQQTLVSRNHFQASPSESGNRSSNGNNNFNSSSSSFVLPTSARKVRDSGSLLILMAFIGFLVYIIWDGMQIKNTDINLVVHGHDSFGNICGRNNKPIEFVERSGQNYTLKPYTKYTLINSQFERYTMLPSNDGELLYVKERLLERSGDYTQQRERQIYESSLLKSLRGDTSGSRTQMASFRETSREQPLVSRHRRASAIKEAAAPSDQNQASQTSRGASPLQVAPLSSQFKALSHISKSNISSSLLEGATQVSLYSLQSAMAPIDYDSLQKNRTSLNSLKSSLMYHYPPMHGYNSPLVESKRQVQATFSGNGNLLTPSSNHHKLTATYGHRTPDIKLILPLPADSSLAARSTAAARGGAMHISSPTSSSTMATTRLNLTTDLLSGQRPLALATNNLTTTIGKRTALRNVHALDDLIGGASESDHFDHMLVPPVSTNNNFNTSNDPRRRAPSVSISSVAHQLPPDGLMNHNDINRNQYHQLLYLTECIDTCPTDHIELIFYRCIPNNWRFSLFPNAINVTRTFIDDILTDVTQCYRELIYTFSLALVLSLALLILLRFLASLIIWSCIMLLISLFLALASYSWLTYYYQILDVNQLIPHESIYADKLALSDRWLIGSIFLTFLAFATIGMVLFMRKRILLVTMLFKESGKAIADMPLLLLQPLLTFAALVAITIAWSIGLICLQSMKSPVVDFSTGFVVFKAETLYKIMKWYHIFAFLWVSHFAIACQHYVIGASVSKWYFSSNRYNLNSPIGASISELILYYLGSVALGSFLVAIFKVIRIITRQIQFLVQRNCMSSTANSNQMDSINSSNTIGPSSGTSCCGSLTYMWRLFLWFFDNIVMIINRDAYVEIAIHGDSFLAGARRAFTVLANNPLRLLAIKSVSNILLTIAKICVVFGTISVAMMLLEEKNSHLNYSWSPVVISAIFAYIVAHWFLSVYEMVIDALFICYCEDYEQAKSRELSTQLAESHFMRQILANGHIF